MRWTVLFQDDFAVEFEGFSADVRVELIAMVEHLERFGPLAKRPQVDTLKGSKIANLKEFRFTADGGVWRVAFAFDTERQAIVLAAGNKAGVSSATFYKRLIALAEKRMAKYEAAQKDK
jgi:hypothetical protein